MGKYFSLMKCNSIIKPGLIPELLHPCWTKENAEIEKALYKNSSKIHEKVGSAFVAFEKNIWRTSAS